MAQNGLVLLGVRLERIGNGVMKVTDFTARALAWRREKRDMIAAGYTETTDFDWRLTRGGLIHHKIVDVKISADGKQVWYRLEPDPGFVPYQPFPEYIVA